MKSRGLTLWTIQQLSEEVERALAVDYAGARNGRTRSVPDLRTIRYYTTLGLLDRPAEMRGRTALYGRRHLLQLVAIKQLQSRGLSLPQIQRQMAGATESILVRLAEREATATGGQAGERSEAKHGAASQAFWKTRPAAVDGLPPDSDRSSGPERAGIERQGASYAYQDMGPLQAIGLDDGVMILLPARRPIDPAEITAIRKSAAALIRHLRRHQLIQPALKGEGDDQAASAND